MLRLVFGEGLRMMAAGLVAGGAASAGLASLMRGMLFEVRPLDPAAFLAAFAAAACYLPARRPDGRSAAGMKSPPRLASAGAD